MAKFDPASGGLYLSDAEYQRVLQHCPLAAGESSRDVARRVLPFLFPQITADEASAQKVCFIVNVDDQG